MSSPLFDTLFRPTTASPAPAPVGAGTASAAPVQVRGTRTRAGNAMNRTRSALLDGAARAVEVSGTRITMAQVAAAAGVAKATLYNHFRTREAVLGALVETQVRSLIDAQSDKALDVALRDVAATLSTHPVLRSLARLEPAALAHLGRIDDTAVAWQLARAGVDGLLGAHDLAGTETVLRWLASYLLSPAPRSVIAADVAVLLAGLPARDAG